MDNSNLKQLLKEYEQKRLIANQKANQKKQELYQLAPRLLEIEQELNKNAISTTLSLLNSNEPQKIENLKEKIQDLRKEKITILKSIGETEDSLLPCYDCKDCQDTGYIKIDDYHTVMCNCLKQKLFNLEYNQSNISNLNLHNFDHFSFDYYSDKINKEKYRADISPRQNIEIIKNICYSFINNFDDPQEKNLLFTGDTGLGKTFLSSCIANELLKKGKTVLYQTAPVMLDYIIDQKFGKETISQNVYNSLFDVDLLIIDDLGTENINNMKFTELFKIINTRLLNQDKKITKTIISTNLNLKDLFQIYNERIGSRLVGYYNICRFFGDDIRFQIKKKS